MPDYKTMYFRLFNKISDAIEILQTAQQEGKAPLLNTQMSLP